MSLSDSDIAIHRVDAGGKKSKFFSNVGLLESLPKPVALFTGHKVGRRTGSGRDTDVNRFNIKVPGRIERANEDHGSC